MVGSVAAAAFVTVSGRGRGPVLRQRGERIATEHSRNCAAEQRATRQDLHFPSWTQRRSAGRITDTVGYHYLRYFRRRGERREPRFDGAVSHRRMD